MSFLALALFAGGFVAVMGDDTGDRRALGGALIAFGGAGLLMCGLRLPQAIGRRQDSGLEVSEGRIELRRTPTEKIVLAAAFWIACLGFYFLLQSEQTSERTRIFAWAGLFLCAAAPIIVALRRASLVISEQGLDYSLFKIGPIAWNDIAAIEAKRFFRYDVIVLKLVDPQAYIRRGLPIGHRLVGWIGFGTTPFRIMPLQLGVSRQRIGQALQLWRDASLTAALSTRNTPSAPVGFGRRKTPV